LQEDEMLLLKRVYAPASTSDGSRVLVDRLWPRGVRKEDARIDWWARELAPSHELRRTFHHEPARYREFVERYRAELAGNPAVERLKEAASRGPVTLLFAARDEERNNATALLEILTTGA
jgi:uncharacterized protein YeaO (DUF488 family)